MIKYIDLTAIEKEIELSGGVTLVLLDRLAKEDIYGQLECARNIFLVDATSKIVWQIQTDFDSNGGSFTNIFADDGGVKGYRWDGGVYEIDLKSGKGVPALLQK
jgi:hypothetical protein